MTAARTTAPANALLQAKVLAVYWCHDQLASEYGYALLYVTSDGAIGMTMLADERSPHDAPLYIGDTVSLREVALRRHNLVDNLTTARAPDAEKVDWLAIWATYEKAPSQIGADVHSWQKSQAAPAVTSGKREQRDADKYPEVAAFIARLKRHAPGPADDDLPPIDPPSDLPGNGGW